MRARTRRFRSLSIGTEKSSAPPIDGPRLRLAADLSDHRTQEYAPLRTHPRRGDWDSAGRRVAPCIRAYQVEPRSEEAFTGPAPLPHRSYLRAQPPSRKCSASPYLAGNKRTGSILRHWARRKARGGRWKGERCGEL